MDPGDEAILRWAVEEDRILITMDKDFGTLIVRERLRHAGVIRIPQCTVPNGRT
jgi:predicted nuclease of predicted toxin-antitoxin system